MPKKNPPAKRSSPPTRAEGSSRLGCWLLILLVLIVVVLFSYWYVRQSQSRQQSIQQQTGQGVGTAARTIGGAVTQAVEKVKGVFRPGDTNPPSETTQTTSAAPVPKSYKGRYYYAGMPKPLPSFPAQITVLTNFGYVVGYCEAKKDPVWVSYRLFKPNSFVAPPRPQGFSVDIRTRARVIQHDYSGSGYDRGHMAPNYAIAVCDGQKGQAETFLMSNIIPQSPALNRKVWEHLEQTEIREYAPRFGQVWVIDGPVFKGHLTLNSGVAIPDACFKIMVEEENGQPRMLAFIMPQTVNGTESPGQFLTSVAEIQRETGLDFFSELPDEVESNLEAGTARAMW